MPLWPDGGFAKANIFRSPYESELSTAYAQMCTRIRTGTEEHTKIGWNVCANIAGSASGLNSHVESTKTKKTKEGT